MYESNPTPQTSPSLLAGPSAWQHQVRVEEWFFRRGMPTAAPGATRFQRLMVRVSPVLIGFIAASLALTVSDLVFRSLEPELFADPDAVWPAWYVGMVFGTVVVGIIAGIFANIRIRTREITPRAIRILTRGLPVAMLLSTLPDTVLGLTSDTWFNVAESALTIILVLLFIGLGVGTFFVWALRQPRRAWRSCSWRHECCR